MSTKIDNDKKTAVPTQPGFSRRDFIATMAAAGLASRSPGLFAAGQPLNFVSYGGSYGKAVNTHLVTPFESSTGIKVEQGINTKLAPIKIQVMSNNVQWDLAELAGGDFLAGVREDLFEPVDTSIVKLDKVPDFAKHEFGIQYALFLSGIGYDQRVISDADAPKNWTEAYDVNRYKGLRGVSKHISDTSTLEAALMAVGVPIDNLYPLDVELAFESLRKLGLDNIFWYESNQEPVNFLTQQLGPISNIASGRMAIANRKGAQIGFVYNQLQLNGDYLVVPKGAKNRDEAFALMNFILNDDQAAVNWMTETTYTISNSHAVSAMPQEIADLLPTSPTMKGKYFQKNFDWWGENLNDVVVRFQQFIAS
jgi:putative spermidine/putrescine transport system substrate-binding protein